MLLFSHIETYERLLALPESPSVLKATWNSLIAFVEGEGGAAQTGGGIIGALLLVFSYYLFSAAGAKIVSVFSILIGIIFMTEFSLGDFVAKWMERFVAVIRSAKQRLLEFKASSKESQNDEALDVEPDDTPEKDEPVIQDFTDVAYSFDVQETEENSDDTPVPDNAEPVPDEGKADEPVEVEEDNPLPMTESENHEYELPPPNLLAEPAQSSQQQEKSQIRQQSGNWNGLFRVLGLKHALQKCMSARPLPSTRSTLRLASK